MENICFLLNQFIRCSAYENIIFCWVMHEQGIIDEIIQSGIKAPSSKNRQPWKYIVIQGHAKEEMLKVFRRGIEREENDSALLPQSKQHIAAAKYTVDVMEEAPTIVLIDDIVEWRS